MRRHGKYRSRPQQRDAQDGRDDGGNGDRDKTSRFPFEQQQFNRQQDGGHGGGEHRRHAARGAGHQQGLALGRREVNQLRENGATRASGHNDGAFGAERAAGPDRDGRRNRFQDRDLRLNQAAAEQNGFEGFGDAVAP